MAVDKQKLLPINGMNMDCDESVLPETQATFIKNHINAINNLEDGASGGQSTQCLTPYPSISTNFDNAYLPHLRSYTVDLSGLTFPATFVSFVRDTTEVDVGNIVNNIGELSAIMVGSGWTALGSGVYDIINSEFIWQKIIWKVTANDYYGSAVCVKFDDGIINGNNTCIGSYYDLKLNQMVWFNYNDANRFNIQLYNATADSYTTVLETPLLNFSLSYRISSIDLVLAVTEEGESRLLYWTDASNPPCKLNIDRAVNNEYWNSSDYINYRTDNEFFRAAKPPPQTRITGSVITTSTKEADYLDSNSYQVAANFIYRDGERSTVSVWSTLFIIKTKTGAVVVNQGLELTNIDVGSIDVSKVNLYYRYGNFGDWRQFYTFERSDWLSNTNISTHIYNYNPLTVYYNFFNDNAWQIIDQDNFNREYDLVPFRCYSQDFLSNNCNGYGWILEGYDNFSKDEINKVSVSITYPTLYSTLGGDYKVLKGGGTYQLCLIGYDENNVATWVQTGDDMKLYVNTTMENNGAYLQNVTVNFGNMTFPIGLTKVAIGRTQNTVINRTLEQGFIQWAVNSLEYLNDNDQAALIGAATKVRIKIDGIDSFNAQNYNQTTTTYQFVEGDNIMIRTSGGGVAPPLVPSATYGVITKQLRSTDGLALIFDMDTRLLALATAGATFQAGDFIEIFTPSNTETTKRFYEISEQLTIDPTTHKYTPNTYTFSKDFNNPTFDTYLITRLQYPLVNPNVALSTFSGIFESHSFSDTVIDSEGEDIGRFNTINENAKQQWHPALIRYSMPYIDDTLINGLNTFKSARKKDYGRQSGGISRMYCNQTDYVLAIMQEERISKVWINRKLIQNAEGGTTLIVADEVLSDAILLSSEMGLQDGMAFYGRGSQLYGWDLKRGLMWGGSFEGVTDISAQYDKQGNAQAIKTYALKQSKAIFNYNNETDHPYFSIYFLSAGFDTKLNQIIFTNFLYDADPRGRMSYVNNNPTWAALSNETVAMGQGGDWRFYSFTPEMYGICEGHRLGNSLVSFKNGSPYFHNLNNETTYLNFYGTTCDKYFSVISNKGDGVKNFMNVGLDSKSKSVTLTGTRYSGVTVKTSNNQASTIPLTSFVQREGFWWSPIYRNTNLGKTIITGDAMKGTWCEILFKGDTDKNSEYSEVRGVTVLFNDSKFTV